MSDELKMQINSATKNPFDEQISHLKSHAVEVLAKEVSRKALAQDGIYVIGFKEYWEKHPEWRETCRAEARALLGWEE